MAIQVNFDGALIRQLGAYIKTDLSAVRQINGVATGVIGTLGLAEGGEVNVPYSVRSHAEAVSIFRGGPLVDHIKTMFLGGAGEVIAIRIGDPTPSSLDLELDGPFTINFFSLDKSARANNILVSLDADTDVLILTILQKNPDCTVNKEIYEVPRTFDHEAVLLRRGERLTFVQDWLFRPALDVLGDAATRDAKEDAVVQVLQSLLLPDDYVQFFDVGDVVPLGLLIYEVNIGGLFGYEKSRIIRMSVESEPYDPLFEVATLFNANPASFFNPSANSYRLTDIVAMDTVPDPSVDGIVTANGDVMSNFYALSGGTNGDDGTGVYLTGTVPGNGGDYTPTWIAGLQVLETEEVNFVQPAYEFFFATDDASRKAFFTNVIALVMMHDKTMSSVAQRKRRTSIIGYPAPQSASRDKTDYLNEAMSTLTTLTADTDRIQDWIAPFWSEALTGSRSLLGGEFMASYIAGRNANVEPQISITFTPVGSLGAEYLYDWTYSEKDRLISQRKSFVEKVKNAFGAVFYRVHHNPTSSTMSVTQAYQEFILRRIDDYVSTYVFKNVEEQFIGRPSYGARTAADIKRFIENLLGNLTGHQIVAFADVSVTWNEDNTVYFVQFRVQPVTEIKFILITMQVAFDLA